ncbi:MAG: M23 family metallopeptidase, partial [Rhodoglobus sp.]
APVVARPAKKRKRVASKVLSTGALLIAGALMVAVSVPSNLFLSDAAAIAPAVQVSAIPAQSLAVSAEAEAPELSRDNYSVTSYAELLRIQYGNSGTYSATTGAIRWPFPYSVPTTDGFGPRDANVSGQAFHNGVDFTPGSGTPIYAIADGIVTIHAEEYGGLGNNVMISHVINGQNIDSVYAHMQYGSSPLVVGEAIRVGDFIGLVGDTGNSYGAHLHFELHVNKVPVNPFMWLTDNAVN